MKNQNPWILMQKWNAKSMQITGSSLRKTESAPTQRGNTNTSSCISGMLEPGAREVAMWKMAKLFKILLQDKGTDDGIVLLLPPISTESLEKSSCLLWQRLMVANVLMSHPVQQVHATRYWVPQAYISFSCGHSGLRPLVWSNCGLPHVQINMEAQMKLIGRMLAGDLPGSW